MTVVTISRMPGSQGDEVAAALAARLGYRLVGRAELVALASQFGATDELARSPELRERSPSFWERLNEERRRHASVLRNVVLSLAEQDNVVIVGLGAGLLLRGLGHVLRVQVVAPPEARIDRVVREGREDRPGATPTRDQARDYLRQRDREAAGYIRYLFNADWLDPTTWDLTVNTGRYSVDDAATIIAAVTASGAVRPSPDDQRRLHNMTLAGHVEAALLNHPAVWVNGLRVKADNGRVLVEGEVIGEEDRETAEQVVRSIDGVREVENELRIQPPPLTGM